MLRFLWQKAVSHEWEGLMKEKMESIEGYKIAKSPDGNELFLSFNQLDEFSYFEFTILGPFNIKTFKGGQITFISSNDHKITCDTDTQEIDTDYSTKMKIGITRIDVDITPELNDFILQNKIGEISLKVENTTVQFDAVEDDIISNSLNKN